MKEKNKNLGQLGMVLSFAFILSGCIGTSPQVSQKLKDNGIYESDICKAEGMTNKYNNCHPFYAISEETADKYINRKKAIEAEKKAKREAEREAEKIAIEIAQLSGMNRTVCEKLGGNSKYFIYGHKDRCFNVAKSDAEKYLLDEKKKAEEKAKKEAEAKRIAEEKAKKEAEAKRIAEDKKVKDRMKKLNISESEVRGVLGWSISKDERLTNNHIDDYLDKKEKQRKAAEYEKKAKIKVGKQYICSDGYDSWVLKHNGIKVTFGEVNFQQTWIGGVYVQNEYDNNALIIDRAKGTVEYNGNKSTCRPR